jgi:hypothetical protein
MTARPTWCGECERRVRRVWSTFTTHPTGCRLVRQSDNSLLSPGPWYRAGPGIPGSFTWLTTLGDAGHGVAGTPCASAARLSRKDRALTS